MIGLFAIASGLLAVTSDDDKENLDDLLQRAYLLGSIHLFSDALMRLEEPRRTEVIDHLAEVTYQRIKEAFGPHEEFLARIVLNVLIEQAKLEFSVESYGPDGVIEAFKLLTGKDVSQVWRVLPEAARLVRETPSLTRDKEELEWLAKRLLDLVPLAKKALPQKEIARRALEEAWAAGSDDTESWLIDRYEHDRGKALQEFDELYEVLRGLSTTTMNRVEEDVRVNRVYTAAIQNAMAEPGTAGFDWVQRVGRESLIHHLLKAQADDAVEACPKQVSAFTKPLDFARRILLHISSEGR